MAILHPNPTEEKVATPNATSTRRLASLDALRGFDMFWILGVDSLVYALDRMTQNGFTNFLKRQLSHSDWEGFRFYDLIFPLFVFMVGVSLVISLRKTIAQEGRACAVQRIFRRSILLFILGIVYFGGLSNPWPGVRLSGVLQRIALVYFFAGLMFCFCRTRLLVGVFVALLAGYWAMMALIPIRDIQLEKNSLAALAAKAGDNKLAAQFRNSGRPAPINPSAIPNSPVWAAAEKMYYSTTNRVTGKFEKGYNVACHFDFAHLPGWKWELFWDPENILSTIPAIASCLLGVFAGLLLTNTSITDLKKVTWLLGVGAAASILGWLWGLEFPVVKRMWTSSFVLVAGGYSSMLLGAFYLIVDVWKKQTWCQPFVWIGMNSITLYLAENVLGGFDTLGQRFAGGNIKAFFDTRVANGFGQLVISVVGLLLAFWFAHFLHKRKVFLRL